MLLTRRTENLSSGDGSLDPQVELNSRATGTVGLGSWILHTTCLTCLSAVASAQRSCKGLAWLLTPVT